MFMWSLSMQKIRNRLHRRLWASPLSAIPAPFRPAAKCDPMIAADIASYEKTAGFAHGAGSMPLRTLLRIERLLSGTSIASAETGCGKSTVFLSRVSSQHKVFCLDDRNEGSASSVNYFIDCSATRLEVVETIFGPTQLTLPNYAGHIPYDLVLIDGPHGYPFPELEYFFFYPHLRTGALLVIDDIHIPTISRLADFLSEDRMFEKVEFIGSTAVFRRTDAPAFDPFGDGWWLQDFNRRRVDFHKDIHLQDGKRLEPITFEGKF
jgi:predicted O-methyltransferase YrrM